MSDTTHLQLPLLEAAQAQKHITHNEALQALDILVMPAVKDKDLQDPPPSPVEGDRYLIAAAATGDWSGKDGQLAAYQDGVWRFFVPGTGWSTWVEDEAAFYVYDGLAWILGPSGGGGGAGGLTATQLADGTVVKVGVNTASDDTNRLSVESDAVLFSHNGAGAQVKVNKNVPADTASHLFQTGFSGRAEFGLTGDDNFHLKVSADGTTWRDALTIDRSTGLASFHHGTIGERASFRNKLINGGFDFWQRGAGAFPSSGYTADRWEAAASGSSQSVSRQSFVLGQTEVAGNPDYYLRSTVTSAAGVGNFARLQQKIVGVATLSGQAVRVSFHAKADAGRPVAIELVQDFGTGGSPSSPVMAIGAQKVDLTTSWQRFELSVTLPPVSTKTKGTNANDHVDLVFWFDAGSSYNARTDTLGQQSGTFDIANVQLEQGSAATEFERRPPGVELDLCQRYYLVGGTGAVGGAYSTTAADFGILFPTKMRAVPSMSFAPGVSVVSATFQGIGRNSTTAPSAVDGTGAGVFFRIANGFAGIAAGQTGIIRNDAFAMDAEL